MTIRERVELQEAKLRISEVRMKALDRDQEVLQIQLGHIIDAIEKVLDEDMRGKFHKEKGSQE